ncbi:MAG: DUF5615 family PIN-like protein [bacterium]|nr:DUF5615 family PIN-like protein [bacterium]
MKFLSDMGVSPKTVAFLQGLGYDAIHLHDQGLNRLQDTAILAKARNEKRILLTHDLDFDEIVAFSGTKLPSVITFRLRNMHPERVNHYLHAVITQHHEMLEQGAIITVTEGRIRVRHLPLKLRPDRC